MKNNFRTLWLRPNLLHSSIRLIIIIINENHIIIFFTDLSSAAVQNVSLTIDPAAVRRGQFAALHCAYDLESKPLYSVKFYRGSREFYRYSPSELPASKIFAFPGINVDVSKYYIIRIHNSFEPSYTHVSGITNTLCSTAIKLNRFGGVQILIRWMRRRWRWAHFSLSTSLSRQSILRQISPTGVTSSRLEKNIYLTLFSFLFLFLCLALASRVFHLIFHFWFCFRFVVDMFVVYDFSICLLPRSYIVRSITAMELLSESVYFLTFVYAIASECSMIP